MYKKQKESFIEELGRILKTSTVIVCINYSGVSACKIHYLRLMLSHCNSKMLVLKNKLLRFAFEGSGDIDHLMKGQVAALYSSDSEALFKCIKWFMKHISNVSFVGGIYEGVILGSDGVQEVIDLPPREQLLQQLVGLLGSPLDGFVNALADPMGGLVAAIDSRCAGLSGD